ncbi:MAG TPA: neutral zinc metallopeptidase [Alphaproteobacteria bacterium]|nr:neutral zinc metallopeptidase [Alphaproteobacteria bacterium]
MRWRGGRLSSNVEDRRGMSMGGVGLAGGGIGAVVLVVVAMLLGVDPSVILQGDPGYDPRHEQSEQRSGSLTPDDELGRFVSTVLADTEDTWTALFRDINRHYEQPKLVLFTGATQSACGVGQAAMGPFYCPRDEKVYIDLSFYRELQSRFRAPGDFAQAYVIAHEIGHHVQNQLGIMQQVDQLRARADRAQANQLSVRVELQADCFAGIWAHHAQRSREVLEQGDLEEALNAASAIGDDRLQKQSQGYVVPESFTHGSSAQRMAWFKRGFESGRLSACDTFSAAQAG